MRKRNSVNRSQLVVLQHHHQGVLSHFRPPQDFPPVALRFCPWPALGNRRSASVSANRPFGNISCEWSDTPGLLYLPLLRVTFPTVATTHFSLGFSVPAGDFQAVNGLRGTKAELEGGVALGVPAMSCLQCFLPGLPDLAFHLPSQF